MKKIFILIILFSLGFGPSLVASPVADFLGIVDFTLSLKSLNQFMERGEYEYLDKNLYIILDGTVSSRELLSAEKEPFLGEIEIVQGEWVGLEEVKIYKGIIEFSGEEYSGLIPARRARRRSENEIKLNSHIIVIGKLKGKRLLPNGDSVPVIQGFLIREML